MSKISQREARRLRARVAELEQTINAQHRSWVSDWPGGTHICSLSWTAEQITVARISTARRLGHAVVATDADDGKRIEFRALPLPVKP
jgi:hypothetical protein